MTRLIRSVIICCLLLGSGHLFSQTIKNREAVRDIEKFILLEKLDSAKVIINKITDDSNAEYILFLREIIISDNLKFKDFYLLISHVIDNRNASPLALHSYLIKNLPKPTNTSKINIDYVKIKWKQILFLADANFMEEAEIEFGTLDKYISQFENNNPSTQRATFYKNTYLSIIETIKRDKIALEILCLANKAIANELKDTTLIIISDYYYAEVIMMNKDLNGYISLCKKNIALDKKIQKRSGYYIENLLHLIDAYLYKGGHEDEVYRLLNEIYQSPLSREMSFSYYVQFLGDLPNNAPKTKLIFQRFGVSNLLAFCDTISVQAQGDLVSNEYYHLLRLCASTLEKKGYYTEAMQMKDKSISLIKTIYTKDLSNTLALNKVRKLEKKKEAEVIIEKEKSKFYSYISILLGVIAMLTVVAIFLQIKKNKKLAKKNIQIGQQRDEIAKRDDEKQLLLKEIHHRVKNNFQVISSLLDLQTKGIEDETALNLAKEGKNRIKSMALIHQKLYQNDNLKIDFEDYVKSLLKYINSAYSNSVIDYNIKIVPNFTLDIDTAIPLGLILNELITNAFKYGLDNDGKNVLSITLEKGKETHSLIVSDNGKGISENLDLKKVNSIGLKLVRRLAKQLHGRVEYEYQNGTTFKVLFKEIYQRVIVD